MPSTRALRCWPRVAIISVVLTVGACLAIAAPAQAHDLQSLLACVNNNTQAV